MLGVFLNLCGFPQILGTCFLVFWEYSWCIKATPLQVRIGERGLCYSCPGGEGGFRDPTHPQLLQVPWGSAPPPIPGIFLSSHFLQRETGAAAMSWHGAANPSHIPTPLAAFPNLSWSWETWKISSGCTWALLISPVPLFSCCCSQISITLVGFVLSLFLFFFWSRCSGGRDPFPNYFGNRQSLLLCSMGFLKDYIPN